MQVLNDEDDDWEYAWSRDQDQNEENKNQCFLAKLFEADSIGNFELTA